MKKSRIIAFAALASLTLSLLSAIAPAQAARDLKGSACSQEGLVRTIQGVTYTCERVNGSLQYAQGRKLSGTLNVLCTPQEAWCVAMTQAFQEKTGITTKFIRLSSGEALTRLIASKNNPEFDVWTGGPNDSHISGRIQGVLDTYKSPTRNMLKDVSSLEH